MKPVFTHDEIILSGIEAVMDRLTKAMCGNHPSCGRPMVVSIGDDEVLIIGGMSRGLPRSAQASNLRSYLYNCNIRYRQVNPMTTVMSETDFLKLFC